MTAKAVRTPGAGVSNSSNLIRRECSHRQVVLHS
jgi:hypothetical protein